MRFDWNDLGAETKRVALERLQMANRAEIQPSIGNGARFDILTRICDNLIIELRSYIWTEVIQDETATLKVEFSCPADWWQHFKQRWFAAWMLKRWPVAMTVTKKEESHRFKTMALLPEFKYEAPDGCGPYLIRTSVGRKY